MNEEENKIQKELKKEINFNDKYKYQEQPFMKIMREFEDMCNRRLGTVLKVKHRSYFESPDARPIQPAPYCAEPKEL